MHVQCVGKCGNCSSTITGRFPAGRARVRPPGKGLQWRLCSWRSVIWHDLAPRSTKSLPRSGRRFPSSGGHGTWRWPLMTMLSVDWIGLRMFKEHRNRKQLHSCWGTTQWFPVSMFLKEKPIEFEPRFSTIQLRLKRSDWQKFFRETGAEAAPLWLFCGHVRGKPPTYFINLHKEIEH